MTCNLSCIAAASLGECKEGFPARSSPACACTFLYNSVAGMGMACLDVLARAKAEFGVPCVAYQVSGEYAMQCAAFANGWLDRDRTILETMMAFRRAGADAVLTYFAPDIAKLLHQQR